MLRSAPMLALQHSGSSIHNQAAFLDSVSAFCEHILPATAGQPRPKGGRLRFTSEWALALSQGLHDPPCAAAAAAEPAMSIWPRPTVRAVSGAAEPDVYCLWSASQRQRLLAPLLATAQMVDGEPAISSEWCSSHLFGSFVRRCHSRSVTRRRSNQRCLLISSVCAFVQRCRLGEMLPARARGRPWAAGSSSGSLAHGGVCHGGSFVRAGQPPSLWASIHCEQRTGQSA